MTVSARPTIVEMCEAAIRPVPMIPTRIGDEGVVSMSTLLARASWGAPVPVLVVPSRMVRAFDTARRARATLRPVSAPSPHLPEHPDRLWRHRPEPSYDVVVIGGGGHGSRPPTTWPATASPTWPSSNGLAGGGNIARNTTIIRANYLWDESAAIYEHALKLWERLAEELDYDLLFSQRGVMNLAHSLADVREGSGASTRTG